MVGGFCSRRTVLWMCDVEVLVTNTNIYVEDSEETDVLMSDEI